MSATTAVVTARNGGRVLVVDDSAVIRQAISKMLKVDFDVAVAADGEAGWETLLQAPDVGVLITDIEMPRLDGYAFICRVRASDDPHIRDLPIIVITGADDDETKTRAFACGATDFITKPLNL
uniref:response regulator n=1 Tax=Acidiferrobacter sp. TaxID=1872107 RepID=UPI002615A8AF